MRNEETYDIFLSLIRLGIGHQPVIKLPTIQNWRAIKQMADEQGLTAVALDGIDLLSSHNQRIADDMPQTLRLEWIGEVLQNYERRYKAYENAVVSLAQFYNQNGIKMMVLKGYACSLDWPKPEHRPCGDIDIWLFGRQKEADFILKKENDIKIDKTHHHHTVFYWDNFMVENHYDFINVYGHRNSKMLEAIFKELGKDDSHFSSVNGDKVYMPSPNLHALFLMRHLVAHFVSVNITLRQVLDWAFFIKAHGKEIDWEWLESAFKEFHFEEFANCINAICVGDLGFPVTIFPKVQFKPDLKERVFVDIRRPEFGEKEPDSYIRKLIYKYKRWHGNRWKHELCFNENRLSSLGRSLWGHLLKPHSI